MSDIDEKKEAPIKQKAEPTQREMLDAQKAINQRIKEQKKEQILATLIGDNKPRKKPKTQTK